MSDWKVEFKRALIDEIISSGSPVRDNPTSWGYLAPDWREIRDRVASIGVDYAKTTHEESRWWDGADTFNDGYEKIGIDAVVTLLDGSVVKFRYDGSASDLIMSLVR